MTTLHPETLRRRARKGAALLDEVLPGWAYDINLATLKLNDNFACILGQVFGSYGDGLSDLSLSLCLWNGGGVEYGFNIEDKHGGVGTAGREVSTQNWAVLQRTWERLVRARTVNAV